MEKQIEIFNEWDIGNGYQIRWQSRLPDELYLQQHRKYLINGFSILRWKDQLSKEGLDKLNKHKDRLKDKFWVRLALIKNNEMVGWTYGWQDSVHVGDFYSAGSLVIPEHRRKGLYTELTKRMLEITKEEGFSSIRSRHLCTNNLVLISKLKMGFTINGFEQNEIMGTLVRMIYHHDELRRNATLFRAGKVDERQVLNTLLS